MESWFSLSLAALVLFGAQRFLYKVSAERRCNTAWTTFSFMGTVAGLSALLFWILGKGRVEDPATLLLLSLVNSLTFFADTVATMEALKHLDAAIAYPVLRLNLALVAVFSVWYFGDALSGSQIAGICLALAVVARAGNQAVTLKPGKGRVDLADIQWPGRAGGLLEVGTQLVAVAAGRDQQPEQGVAHCAAHHIALHQP